MALMGILILFWVVVLGAVAFFLVREVRSKRKGPADFDRYQHQAAGEASMRASTRGPNAGGIGFGG